MKHEFYLEKEEGTVIRMYFSDWKGATQEWRNTYFDILTWKNTWCIPFSLDILSTHENEAYIKMVVKREDAKKTIEWLEAIGYENIKTEDVVVGVFDYYDESIDEQFFE